MKIERVKILFVIVEVTFAISSIILIFGSNPHRRYPFPPPSLSSKALEISSTVSGLILLILSAAFFSRYPSYSRWGLIMFIAVVCLGLLFPEI